jgi:predicted PhzF superfamily epimerase YddE/YHI9
MTYLLRVFTDENGNYGDAASVVIDEGRHISDDNRQEMARELNTGETIFINGLSAADISVMHPQGEIGFAGVGIVGTAWLFTKLRGKPTERMRSRDSEITTWQDGNITWARGLLSIIPPWNYKQLDNADAVEGIKLEETKNWQHTMVWAWIDEAKGLIRARTFAADWEIPEAQGNGSGAMLLAAKLGRAIEIKHGEGSVIFAKPASNDYADIGGRVIESPKTLEIALPEYKANTKPDYLAVGSKLDRLLEEHFAGQDIVLRCIGSQDHPGKTLNELAEIIIKTGTDKYDPVRTGQGYNVGTDQGKHIDFFGTPVKVHVGTDIFTLELLDDFYNGSLGDRGYAIRIDIVIVYDASKLTRVEHLYGDDVEESDGFVFKEPGHKPSAVLGVLKIL